MKKDKRIPKSAVEELLTEFGLTMRRKTLSNSKRAWVVSDRKAFNSLKSVYAFYYHQKKGEKSGGIKFLLDKFRSKDET